MPPESRPRRAANARRTSRHPALLGVALVFCVAACSRRSSDATPSAKSAAAPSAAAPSVVAPPQLPKAKPPAPVVAPTVPPQLVACGDRDFYRITHATLDAFEIAEPQPPPQIRGNRVARQVNKLEIADPVSLTSLAKHSVLVVAKAGAFRYQLGEKQAQPYTASRSAAGPAPQELPAFVSNVPGVVIDTATEGDRVAVLGIELVEDSYRPTVVVFSKGKEEARLNLGPTIGVQVQPKLDLCLIAGRPWVLVGGTQWLQLFDWSSRRLLAEW